MPIPAGSFLLNFMNSKKTDGVSEPEVKKTLDPFNIKIPSDPSSAAFYAAICLLNKNSRLKIKNVCRVPNHYINSTIYKFF